MSLNWSFYDHHHHCYHTSCPCLFLAFVTQRHGTPLTSDSSTKPCSHTEWHLLLEFPRSLRQQPHSSSDRKDTLCGARSTVSSLLCSLILAKSPEHGSSNTKGSQNLVRHFHSSTQILFFFWQGRSLSQKWLRCDGVRNSSCYCTKYIFPLLYDPGCPLPRPISHIYMGPAPL